MAGFVYNPAESIRRDFEQTGSAMGNIFAQIIQQQKRDYDVAENAYANIEALKKDLNIYGQKSVTDKANALLGNVGSAILANGKLDYSKLGEVRRAVSDIKDLKTGYELASKEYEKRLQLGLSVKEDFGSFEKFYTDMNKLMGDENLIKNPRDLQAAFSKVHTNNLDANKKFVKTFTGISPLVPIEKEIDNSKGGKTLVKTQAPQGWVIGENGASMPEFFESKNPDGTVTKVPYLKYMTELIKAKDSSLIPLIKEQNPVATKDLSDEQIVDFHIRTQIVIPNSIIEKKSAAGVKGEEAQADILGVKAKFAPQQEKADLESKRANASASRASANYTNKKAENEEVEMNYDPFVDFTKVSIKGAGTGKKINLTKYPIGKDVSLNVNGQQGIIKSVARDEDGKTWVEVWQNAKDQITTNVDKSDRRAGFRWRKVSNLDEFNTELTQEINIGTGIPAKQKAKIRKAVGTLYNLPSRQTNIISAAPTPGSTKLPSPGGAIPVNEF